MYEKIKYLPLGDKALVMEFGNEISKDINAKIRNVMRQLSEIEILGIEELLPTYRSIMIMYEPLKIEYEDLVSKLEMLSDTKADNGEEEIRIVEIPTLYGNEYGPDIEYVAEHNHITVDEVIKIHTGTDYLVYMLGFTPGFTYLGGIYRQDAC